MADVTSRSARDAFDAVSGDIGASATAAGHKAVEAVESGRQTAARGIQQTADTLRSAAERLPGGPKIKEMADGAASMLDGTARYLRDKDATDMLGDFQARARANPAAFLIGALAVGFVAGRMLRRG